MTTKQKILGMIERLANDVTYDRVLYHIEVMKELEARLERLDQEPWIDHDEVFRKLMDEHAKDKTPVDPVSRARPGADSRLHRKEQSKASRAIHPTPEKGRRKAKKVS